MGSVEAAVEGWWSGAQRSFSMAKRVLAACNGELQRDRIPSKSLTGGERKKVWVIAAQRVDQKMDLASHSVQILRTVQSRWQLHLEKDQ